ncbi:hypothetical protein ACFL54_02575 [Planctomycetota bacterium]
MRKVWQVPLEARTDDNADYIEWVSFPVLDEKRIKTLVLLAVIFAVSAAAAFFFSFGYGLISVLLLAVSLGRYFFPTRYRVDDSGVKTTFLGFTQLREWGIYARHVVHKDGIFLSPFQENSRLDSFRGLFVRFSPELDKEKVLIMVKRHILAK